MYLVDTNLISEARKGARANRGVQRFFAQAAARLERWLESLLDAYAECVLDFDSDMAQLWGALRVPHPEQPLDKQIAATALIHGLTVVTRNARHFADSAVPVLNPFESEGP